MTQDFPKFNATRAITVRELKELIKDWPDIDERGEQNTVWVGNHESTSNECRRVVPLNRGDLLLDV